MDVIGIVMLAWGAYTLGHWPQVATTIVYCVFFSVLAVFGICLKMAQKKFLHM